MIVREENTFNYFIIFLNKPYIYYLTRYIKINSYILASILGILHN